MFSFDTSQQSGAANLHVEAIAMFTRGSPATQNLSFVHRALTGIAQTKNGKRRVNA